MRSRVLSSFVMFLFALNVWSQHFAFMGIEMNCPIDSFVQRLQDRNFVLSESITVPNSDTERWMEGVFAGNEVLLQVESTPISDMVYMVSVTKKFDHDRGEQAQALWNFYVKNIEKNYIVSHKDNKGQDDVYYYIDDVGVIRAVMNFSEKERMFYVMLFYVDIKNSDLGKQEDGLDI